MPTSSYAHRDTAEEDPFTIDELIGELQQWADAMGGDSTLLITGINGPLCFTRFKSRGEKLLCMEMQEQNF